MENVIWWVNLNDYEVERILHEFYGEMCML